MPGGYPQGARPVIHHDNHEMFKDGFGPWSPACMCDPIERAAQLRCLAAIVHLQLHDRQLIAELRSAETDPGALGRALGMVERLPSLRRRHLLAAHSAVCWPPRMREKAGAA
jgi:hypothetical protein